MKSRPKKRHQPLAAFAWMVPNLRRILHTAGIEGIVIHPAMVYEPTGGVFLRFARDARKRDAIRVVESENVRWPLAHSADLATLYALALERAPSRSSYIGAAIEGFSVGASRAHWQNASAPDDGNRTSFPSRR
jgi:nucleoside-diphosphate-sugar epimerase